MTSETTPVGHRRVTVHSPFACGIDADVFD